MIDDVRMILSRLLDDAMDGSDMPEELQPMAPLVAKRSANHIKYYAELGRKIGQTEALHAVFDALDHLEHCAHPTTCDVLARLYIPQSQPPEGTFG